MRLLKVYLFEYSILGVATGTIAAAIGTLTAWSVIVFLMNVSWIFLPQIVIITVLVCLFVTMTSGYLGTWRALGEKAFPHLRNR